MRMNNAFAYGRKIASVTVEVATKEQKSGIIDEGSLIMIFACGCGDAKTLGFVKKSNEYFN